MVVAPTPPQLRPLLTAPTHPAAPPFTPLASSGSRHRLRRQLLRGRPLPTSLGGAPQRLHSSPHITSPWSQVAQGIGCASNWFARAAGNLRDTSPQLTESAPTHPPAHASILRPPLLSLAAGGARHGLRLQLVRGHNRRPLPPPALGGAPSRPRAPRLRPRRSGRLPIPPRR
jgi:hypothetical protein